MEHFLLSGAGWHVTVSGAGEAVRARLDLDLGGFLRFGTEAPAGSRELGRIRVSVDPDRFQEWQRRTAGVRYHDLVMHFPRRADRRRFGRLAVVDGTEVVFGTTKGSIYLVDPARHSVELVHTDEVAAAKEVRRLVRDQLYLPWAQQHGAVVVHSSAFADEGDGGTLVVAPASGGKTSFFLAALAAKRFQLLSGDRTVVTRDGARLWLTASPEKVNLFPGSLAAYPQTADLVADRDGSGHWQVAEKFHLRWSELFERFGGRPATEPVPLARIVVPRFGSRWSQRPMRATEVRQAVLPEVLSAGDPLAVPNWLAWYQPTDGYDRRTVELLTTTPAVAVTWSDVRDIDRYLGELPDSAPPPGRAAG